MTFDDVLAQYQSARDETRTLCSELDRARNKVREAVMAVQQKEKKLALARKRLATACEQLHPALDKELGGDMGGDAHVSPPGEETGPRCK